MPANENEEFEFRLRAEKEAAAAPAEQPKPVEEGNTLRDIAAPAVRIGADILGGAGDVADLLQRGGTKLTQAYDRMRGQPQVPDRPPASQVPMTSDWMKENLAKRGVLPTAEARTGTEKALELGGSVALAAPEMAVNAARAVPGIVRDIPSAVRGLGEAPGIRTLLGKDVHPARLEAGQAGQKVINQTIGAEEGNAQWGVLHQQAKQQQLQQLTDELDKLKTLPEGMADTDALGNTIRQHWDRSMTTAREARDAAANTNFAEVSRVANEKEAAGQRIDIVPLKKELLELKAKAKGVGDVETKIDKLLSAIEGKPAQAPVAPPRPQWAGPGYKPPTPTSAAPPAPKTFEQLELARRYINDLAFSKDAAAFDSVFQNQAKRTGKALDEAMGGFIGEPYTKYKAEYGKMSEPLDAIDTKIGDIISGARGGLKGDAMRNVAAADVPGRLFKSKEGIEALTDAIGGKVTAEMTPEALATRAQAEKTVDSMVENWLLKDLSKGTGASAVKKLKAPNMEPVLSTVPGAAQRVGERFGKVAELESTSADLVKRIAETGKSAEKSAELAMRLKNQADLANRLLNSEHVMQQSEGVNMYYQMLESAQKDGVLTKDQLDVTLNLFGRAKTLEEKTKLAKNITRVLGFGGVAAGAGSEVAKHLF